MNHIDTHHSTELVDSMQFDNKNCTIKNLSKLEAIQILHRLYQKLSEQDFLIYGDLAFELLNPQNQNEFEAIELVTPIHVHAAAKNIFNDVLNHLNIHFKYTEQLDYCIFLNNTHAFRLNIISREVNHTHFPRSFITKSQYQFNPHNISYYNNEFDELDTIELTQYLSNTQNELISLPCVHEDFLEFP